MTKIEGKNGISAMMIADSICAISKQRIMSMELRFHGFILPRVNAIRLLSISLKPRTIDHANDSIALIGNSPLLELWEYGDERPLFSNALSNELIRCLQYSTAIVTATEWNNLFTLRSDASQPELQELAKCAYECMHKSTPTELNRGQWHLPYITQEDYMKHPLKHLGGQHDHIDDDIEIFEAELVQLSVARCARVSYLTHDNKPSSIADDIKIYSVLEYTSQFVYFEHQATPLHPKNPFNHHSSGITHTDTNGAPWSANFKAWVQNRQLADHT